MRKFLRRREERIVDHHEKPSKKPSGAGFSRGRVAYREDRVVLATLCTAYARGGDPHGAEPRTQGPGLRRRRCAAYGGLQPDALLVQDGPPDRTYPLGPGRPRRSVDNSRWAL